MFEYRRVNIAWSFIFHEILQSYVMGLPKYRPEKQHHTLSLFDVILPFGPEHVQFITQGPLPVSRWCWSVVPHGFSWGILRQLGFLLFLGMTVYHDCAHRIPRKLIHILFYLFPTVWETAQPGMFFNVFNVFHILCDSFCILRGKSTSQKHNTFHIPRCSMYTMYTYIWLIYVVNVGTYSIHGAYGICNRSSVDFSLGKTRWFSLCYSPCAGPLPLPDAPAELVCPWAPYGNIGEPMSCQVMSHVGNGQKGSQFRLVLGKFSWGWFQITPLHPKWRELNMFASRNSSPVARTCSGNHGNDRRKHGKTCSPKNKMLKSGNTWNLSLIMKYHLQPPGTAVPSLLGDGYFAEVIPSA
jgi:hypothetical protein